MYETETIDHDVFVSRSTYWFGFFKLHLDECNNFLQLSIISYPVFRNITYNFLSFAFYLKKKEKKINLYRFNLYDSKQYLCIIFITIIELKQLTEKKNWTNFMHLEN